MKVFVYGTLKKGYSNHRLLQTSEYIGNGKIEGYEIYDLGFYPGIVPGDRKDEVYGEVYEITEETLVHLDRLEGEGFLYIREVVEVEMDGGSVEASIYVFNRSLNGATRLVNEWGKSA